MEYQGDVLMCPFMAVGHVTPMLELSKHLAKLGFTVTFLFPGKNLLPRAVSKDDDERIKYEVVDFGALEVDGGTEYILSPGLRQVKLNTDDYEKFIPVVYPKFMAIRSKIQELIQATKPLCVVMDPMLFSAGIIVNDLTTLPIYAFIPFAAASVACFRYVMLNGFTPPEFTIPELGFEFHAQDYPGLDVPSGDHPQGFVHVQRNEAMHKNCKGALFNTWIDIEHGSLEALRSNSLCVFPKPVSDSIFGIGPMISTTNSFFRSDREEYSKCKAWLDGKPASSVLFIARPGRRAGRGVCSGFRSERSFVRLGAQVRRQVPVAGWIHGEEQGERTGGSRLGSSAVHPPVGGFVMTSGWNSVLESLVLNPRGVVLVTWPIYQDHLRTCRLLVDGLKIGVEVAALTATVAL